MRALANRNEQPQKEENSMSDTQCAYTCLQSEATKEHFGLLLHELGGHVTQ